MLNQQQINEINRSKKNLAVVLGGNAGALGIIRNLGINKVPVIAVSENNFVLKSRYCTGLKIKGTTEIVNILLELPKVIKKKVVLLTDTDRYMELIIENWERLKKDYLTPVGENIGPYKSLTTKSLMETGAKKAGLDVPITYTGGEQFAIKEFPVLVKPLAKDRFYQLYGKKAIRCNDINELKSVLKITDSLGGSVTQEIIEGSTDNLYCITLYRNKFGRIIIGNVVSKLREFPRYGTGTVHSTCRNDEVVNKSISLLNSSGFVGIAMIEFKYSPKKQKLYLIEVNGRFPIEAGINNRIGDNFVYDVYQDIIEPRVGSSGHIDYAPPTKPVVWVLFPHDIRACLSNRINFFQEYLSYFKNYTVKPAIWDCKDIMPGIYHLAYLFKKAVSKFINRVTIKNNEKGF